MSKTRPLAPAAARGLDHALNREHVLDRAQMQMRGNARAALEARPVNAPLGADVCDASTSVPGPTPSGSHLARPPVGMSGASRSTTMPTVLPERAARAKHQPSQDPQADPLQPGSSAPTVRPTALPLHLCQHSHFTRARQFERVRDAFRDLASAARAATRLSP